MTETQKKILEMLAQNKINTDEAYRLLNAVNAGEKEPQSPSNEEPGPTRSPGSCA